MAIALFVVYCCYVLTIGTYLALQICFAERARRRFLGTPEPDHTPSVDVIVPCYNEDPAVLADCLASIAAQDYKGELRVYVVDDGSANRGSLDPVYRRHAATGRFRLIVQPENRGKRQAQAAAIADSRGEIVITVDSDTVVEPDGVRRLVAGFADPLVGAAMGEMLAANERANLLTRLIHMRYWYACNQERAAQSWFGAVLCCVGPFSAYRRSALEQVLDEYLHHTFRGRPSTHGEDRHLTNLMLRHGMRTAYVPTARVFTFVPERIRPFLRQQLRWNRCVYRDILGLLPKLPALGAYVALDAFAQIFGPVLLALTLLLAGLRSVLTGAGDLPWYGAGLAAVAVGYCAYGMWRTRSGRFLGFALYGLVHCGLLIPVRVRALLSLTDDRWGQRGVRR